MEHVFRDCTWATQVWFRSPLGIHFHNENQEEGLVSLIGLLRLFAKNPQIWLSLGLSSSMGGLETKATFLA